MAIKVVSYKVVGNTKLTEHIKLKMIQCKDGTDEIKYCMDTLNKIEELYKIIDATGITITSGYRTSYWNKKIGGASKSSHTEGYAIDINFKSKYSHKQICCMAQDLGFKGVAYISSTAVHLDMKPRNYRGDERYGYSNNVGNDFYKYFGIAKGSLPTSVKKTYTGEYPVLPSRGYFKKGDKGNDVKKLQQFLNWSNSSKLSADGILGNKTIAQVKVFQKNTKLTADGLFGKNSLDKAKTYTK